MPKVLLKDVELTLALSTPTDNSEWLTNVMPVSGPLGLQGMLVVSETAFWWTKLDIGQEVAPYETGFIPKIVKADHLVNVLGITHPEAANVLENPTFQALMADYVHEAVKNAILQGYENMVAEAAKPVDNTVHYYEPDIVLPDECEDDSDVLNEEPECK